MKIGSVFLKTSLPLFEIEVDCSKIFLLVSDTTVGGNEDGGC